MLQLKSLIGFFDIKNLVVIGVIRCLSVTLTMSPLMFSLSALIVGQWGYLFMNFFTTVFLPEIK